MHQKTALGRHVSQDGRSVEVGPVLGKRVTSDKEFSAVGESVLDVKVDFGEGSSVDERTVGGGRREGRSEGEGGD